jgi:hypothetical protein
MANGGPVGSFKPTEGYVWRMLTIGLLLGSKFLDDNTFQNRSWAEVTNIPVGELNKLEQEWLESINYQLYVNLDTSDDFNAWIENWRIWRENKNTERKATLDRLAPLAPLNTNVQRSHSYQQPYSSYTKSASRDHQNSSYMYTQGLQNSAWSANSYDYPTPQLTPPSAVDSGYNTPEYPSATGGGPRFNDWSVYHGYSREFQQPQQQASYQTRIAAYNTPPYSGHYNQYNIWQVGGTDCPCDTCLPYQNLKPFQTPLFGYTRMLHPPRQVAV